MRRCLGRCLGRCLRRCLRRRCWNCLGRRLERHLWSRFADLTSGVSIAPVNRLASWRRSSPLALPPLRTSVSLLSAQFQMVSHKLIGAIDTEGCTEGRTAARRGEPTSPHLAQAPLVPEQRLASRPIAPHWSALPRDPQGAPGVVPGAAPGAAPAIAPGAAPAVVPGAARTERLVPAGGTCGRAVSLEQRSHRGDGRCQLDSRWI